MRLDGKFSESVNVVSTMLQASALGQLFILYTSELFNIVGNHIVGYVDATTIYAVIPRPFSRPQVMESPNQGLAAINSWCLDWHMRFNPKKTKSMLVSWSWIVAPGYDDLALGGAEF